MKPKEHTYTEEDVVMANRQLNIAYIWAGCLQQACEDMDYYLKKINSGLRFENRRVMCEVLGLSKRIQSAIDRLEKISILTCSEEAVYKHDDALFKYYAHLLQLTQVIGSDEYSELRSLYLYNYIKNFEPRITFEKMDIREQIGFYGTRRRLAEGNWNMEEARKCLKLKSNLLQNDKDTDETSEGEA